MLRLDLGCGAKKKPGFVGLDAFPADGVDRVIDISNEDLPYPDNSVDEVFSSHFFEHIPNPHRGLREIVRAGKPGARVEIWTPYQKSGTAYLMGHVIYWNEVFWSHLCMEYPDIWFPNVAAMLRLDRFHYVVSNRTEQTLSAVPLPFAIRFFHDVAVEFGVFLTVVKGEEYLDKQRYKSTVGFPELTVGTSRENARPLDAPRDFWRVER